MSLWKRCSYSWITLGLFAVSLAGHWILAWSVYAEEATRDLRQPDVMEYLAITARDTLENWQSEFLQLLWQVAGLAFFWHLGSPSSKEGHDRVEEKLDYIIRKIGGTEAEPFSRSFRASIRKPTRN